MQTATLDHIHAVSKLLSTDTCFCRACNHSIRDHFEVRSRFTSRGNESHHTLLEVTSHFDALPTNVDHSLSKCRNPPHHIPRCELLNGVTCIIDKRGKIPKERSKPL